MGLVHIVLKQFILISQYYIFRTSHAEYKNVFEVTIAAWIPMW